MNAGRTSEEVIGKFDRTREFGSAGEDRQAYSLIGGSLRETTYLHSRFEAPTSSKSLHRKKDKMITNQKTRTWTNGKKI
jgi:hypothetical protein